MIESLSWMRVEKKKKKTIFSRTIRLCAHNRMNGLRTQPPISCSDQPSHFSCPALTRSAALTSQVIFPALTRPATDIIFVIRIKEKFHELCDKLTGKVKGETQIRALPAKFSGGKTDHSRTTIMKKLLRDK